MKTTAAGLVAALLLVGCLSEGDNRTAPTPARDPGAGGAGDDRGSVGAPIVQLPEYAGQSYQDLLNRLGPPAHSTTYTIQNAPTKGWNHAALFSRYPKTDANKDVLITETTWRAGEYVILVCFHIVAGEKRCLVARRVHKAVRY